MCLNKMTQVRLYGNRNGGHGWISEKIKGCWGFHEARPKGILMIGGRMFTCRKNWLSDGEVEAEQRCTNISPREHATRNKISIFEKYCILPSFQWMRYDGVWDKQREWISQSQHAQTYWISTVAKSCMRCICQWIRSNDVEDLWLKGISQWKHARGNELFTFAKFGRIHIFRQSRLFIDEYL